MYEELQKPEDEQDLICHPEVGALVTHAPHAPPPSSHLAGGNAAVGLSPE